MPIHPWTSNFTSGEITEQMLARTDWGQGAKYNAAAMCLGNFVVRPQGGITRRAGTVYLGEVKDSTKTVRLVRFEFNVEQAYVLEFGEEYVRVWANRARVTTLGPSGIALVTNGTFATDLAGWTVTTTGTGTAAWNAAAGGVARLIGGASGLAQIAQAIATVPGEVYFLAFTAASGPIAVAVGTANGLQDVRASEDFGTGTRAIRFTATTPTSWIQFVMSEPTPTDLDDISVELGVPTDIETPYLEAELMELRFEQSADVLYIAHRSHPPAKLQRLAANVFEYVAIDFDPGPTTLLPDNVAQPFTGPLTVTGGRIRGGLATATGGAGTIDFTYLSDYLTDYGSAPVRFANGVAQSITDLDAGANSFEILLNGDMPDPEDAIRYNSGTGGTLPAYIPDGAFAYDDHTGTYTFPAASARVEHWAWNADDGYPGVVTLFQQRLWFAGSPGFPDRVWGSVTADYENFATDVEDDAAVEYQLATSGVNMIRWMKALSSGLTIGTSAGEITIEGGGDTALTPTNVRARERSFYGSDETVDALRTVNVVLFVQRGALRIREFTYSFEQDTYVAPDITIVAEHLTREGIVDFARSISPDSILFVVTRDGILAVCTYERGDQVVAWSHHGTAGTFERVVVIPNACHTGDEVWVVVRRTINGVPRRYLEVFDGRLNTDAGLTYAGEAAGTFTGLGHLEGQAIKAVGDDGTVYDLTVTGGEITLPDSTATTTLEAGLHYTSTLQTVRPEFSVGAGTVQAMRKHWNHATVRVYCTESALLFNEETILERPEGASDLDDYTGDMARQTNFGWSREGQLVLQTLEPKTATILGITGAVQVENP